MRDAHDRDEARTSGTLRMAFNPLAMELPTKLDFRKPEDWTQWHHRWEYYRLISCLSGQDDMTQINTLLYAMGEQAEDVLTALKLTEEQKSYYVAVTSAFEKHFPAPKECHQCKSEVQLYGNKSSTKMAIGSRQSYSSMDYHSRFFELEQLKRTTKDIALVVEPIFARFGVPRTIRTDYVPQFTSTEFKELVQRCEATHTTSSPYYPQSNGMAEGRADSKAASEEVLKRKQSPARLENLTQCGRVFTRGTTNGPSTDHNTNHPENASPKVE
ncbi:hypothetical protein MTO96_022771 [Rhipicephalus appendiculatus]